ncbi:flagellar motor protein MotB [Phycisphaerales bacterium AB-hyl4]|uniref:Flagellar motor protein MotB n=1 Tax=Natronomicrosphaera hydrolytica TaxID=3242702 RepID=A0ABV4U0Q5_9BACT
MMSHAMKMLSLGVVLMMGMGSLSGCQVQRLQEERDALWIQNDELQDELNRARAALDQSEADRRELLAELERARGSRRAEAEPQQPARESGFRDIAGVETIERRGSVTVRVPGDVLFAPGQVQLRQQARQTLTDVARVIQNEYPNQTIRIEGYTDTDPIRQSGWADNLELSLQRSAAVHRHLQEQGINPERMYAAGFGETQPRGTKEQSRRVEIVVVLQE